IVGKEKVLKLLQNMLSYSSADQTEISFMGGNTSLTRFANNYIHQNVTENNTTVKVRSIFGQKIGTASSNNLAPEALKELVARAEELAHLQVDDPEFKSLPGPNPSEITTPEPDETTYSASAELRANGVAVICRKSAEKGLTASGAFRTGGSEIGVVNSLGLTAYHRGANSDLITVIMGESGSGYADRLSPTIAAINAEEIADEAIGKALRSQNPRALEPGEYEVILEEYAVGEMLQYISYLGMGALALQEGRSFMQLDRLLMSPLITIYDDGSDPQGLVNPFDAEGVARQRVNLIEQGICKAVVYDSYTANREAGKQNTGHSIGVQGDMGPIPLNLFMEPGDSSKEEMVKQTKRGLWVTRFHYVNPLIPNKAVLTGMTRDGTFLIEDGEIVGPVKNFRFTQSGVEALNAVQSLTQTRRLQGAWGGGVGYLVPALKIARFNFNSATEF
ncbi:MAG: TldD/PmbA family protein, partial [Chloroflexota bacterium]